MAKTLQPAYRVVKRDGPFAVRAYDPMVIAEVPVMAARKQALDEGFHILSAYIRGHNDARRKMPMMVPVSVQPGGDTLGGKGWMVRFIMPPGSTVENLPGPNDERIGLFAVPVARAAICRFNGRADDEALKRHTSALKAWIMEERLNAVAPPTYAFYDSPFTLPMWRRNEVMVAVEY